MTSSPGTREFVALAALMMSLAAFSIDAVLPALDAVREELGVADANDAQLVVSVLLAGMGVGHLLYGPVSDAVGRRPAIAAGILIFLCGTLCWSGARCRGWGPGRRAPWSSRWCATSTRAR